MPVHKLLSDNGSRSRGRPRRFDMEKMLDSAIGVFRERGFHSASVTDLTQATALTAGSLYKAFQDKQAVFLAALDRYISLQEDARTAALPSSRTGREAIQSYLNTYAETSSGSEGIKGCLVVRSLTEIATLEEKAARRVKEALSRSETRLADLIRRGKRDGSLAADLEEEAAARLMLCVLQGMRVIGKTGRTRAEMDGVVRLALKVLD